MLLEIQICFRCYKIDGSAITREEYNLLGSTDQFIVQGIEEEERSVNLIGCLLRLDDFKGRGASEKFFQTLNDNVGKFSNYMNKIDINSFITLISFGVKADILISCKIDDNTMDFECPPELSRVASRLDISVLFQVNLF